MRKNRFTAMLISLVYATLLLVPGYTVMSGPHSSNQNFDSFPLGQYPPNGDGHATNIVNNVWQVNGGVNYDSGSTYKKYLEIAADPDDENNRMVVLTSSEYPSSFSSSADITLVGLFSGAPTGSGVFYIRLSLKMDDNEANRVVRHRVSNAGAAGAWLSDLNLTFEKGASQRILLGSSDTGYTYETDHWYDLVQVFDRVQKKLYIILDGEILNPEGLDFPASLTTQDLYRVYVVQNIPVNNTNPTTNLHRFYIDNYSFWTKDAVVASSPEIEGGIVANGDTINLNFDGEIASSTLSNIKVRGDSYEGQISNLLVSEDNRSCSLTLPSDMPLDSNLHIDLSEVRTLFMDSVTNPSGLSFLIPAFNVMELLEDVAENEIIASIPKKTNQNLTLPAKWDNDDVGEITLTWTSDDTDIITDDGVITPNNSMDISTALTLKLHVIYKGAPIELTKIIPITVYGTNAIENAGFSSVNGENPQFVGDGIEGTFWSPTASATQASIILQFPESTDVNDFVMDYQCAQPVTLTIYKTGDTSPLYEQVLIAGQEIHIGQLTVGSFSSLTFTFSGIDAPLQVSEIRLFLNAQGRVNLDATDIVFANTILTGDLYLTGTGLRGSKINWSSSKKSVISDDGNISRGTVDETVIMTAVVSDLNDGTISPVTKEFTFTVKAKEQNPSHTGGGGGGIYAVSGSANTVGAAPPEIVSDIKSEGKFKDVPEDYWGYDYIMGLYEKGIVSGKSADTFEPESAMKREEFLKLIIEALGLTGDAASVTFLDTDAQAWYYEYIKIALSNQIIFGKSEELFGIGDEITRQDAAVILCRGLNAKGYRILSKDYSLGYEDGGEISEYATDRVRDLSATGILKGDTENCFNPNQSLKRVEGVVILANAGEKFAITEYTNLYYKEEFTDVALFSLDGGASFTLENNTLVFDDSVNKAGATVWLKKEMPKNYTVKYKAKAVDPQLCGNINMFLSAKTIEGAPPYEYDFGGNYNNYHKTCDMYILTITADFDVDGSSNIGYTRFRRDPGFAEISNNPEIKTLHNHEHNIEITKQDDLIKVTIDGKQAHFIADANHIDRTGFFGFRTWKTKVVFYDFEVYAE